MNSRNKKKEPSIRRKHNEQKPNDFMANLVYPSLLKRTITKEKEINQYITLKLENGKTFIYVNGKRFIQCIRLILNIPKDEIPKYDEIESIDQAVELQNKHLYQNRIVMGPMARPLWDQWHDITPEQEFWGHCSNIQAWVENGYDTRILKSNVSFPLLRELAQAGDPLAKKVFKEEIALRLESGYPSVVEYLINQGYIKHFTAFEFKTILDTTNLIKNLSNNPPSLNRFLQSCALKFPDLLKDILLKLLELPNGKKLLISSISIKSRPPFFRINPQYLISIKQALQEFLGKIDFQMEEDIIEIISEIERQIKELNDNVLYNHPFNFPELFKNHPLEILNFNEFLGLQEQMKLKNQFLHKLYYPQPRCSYCGRLIPKGSDICNWCGHKRDDDEGGFFPYPYIFKPPSGGGGSMKDAATVIIKIKSRT
jgi:hypothetical protein